MPVHHPATRTQAEHWRAPAGRAYRRAIAALTPSVQHVRHRTAHAHNRASVQRGQALPLDPGRVQVDEVKPTGSVIRIVRRSDENEISLRTVDHRPFRPAQTTGADFGREGAGERYFEALGKPESANGLPAPRGAVAVPSAPLTRVLRSPSLQRTLTRKMESPHSRGPTRRQSCTALRRTGQNLHTLREATLPSIPTPQRDATKVRRKDTGREYASRAAQAFVTRKRTLHFFSNGERFFREIKIHGVLDTFLL